MLALPPPSLNSVIQTLHGLFLQVRRIGVTQFQRAYSWGEDEVDKLASDMWSAFLADQDFYFLGSMFFIAEKGGTAAEVLDGQQRLATFMVMLAYMRDRLTRENRETPSIVQLIQDDEGEPRFALCTQDQDFFRTYVCTPGKFEALRRLSRTQNALPPPQARLALAAEVIGTRFDDIAPADLARFSRYVRGKAVFNLITTTDRKGAPGIFLTLNSSGLDLSGTDLLKADLFNKADYKDEELERVSTAWDTLCSDLEPEGPALLWEVLPMVTSRDLLADPRKIATLRRTFTSRIEPRVFLERDLPEYAEALAQIRSATVAAGAATEDVNRRIRVMLPLREKYWVGPLLMLMKAGQNEEPYFARVVQLMERLAYAGVAGALTGQRKRDRWSELYQAEMRERVLLAPGGPLRLTDKEGEELLSRMRSPFNDDHARRKLMVIRMNAALGEPLVRDDDASVEHILPQKAQGEWLDLFPDASARVAFSREIGNLTLVTKHQNQVAGDQPFRAKRKVYFETKNAPVRAMTKDIAGIDAWTPDRVRERTDRFMAAIARDWDLPPYRG